MKMRYKLLILVLVIILCMTPYSLDVLLPRLGAYAANDNYVIRQEDGSFYIIFPFSARFEYTPQTLGGTVPEFSSVKEMKDTIISGTFSESELIKIVNYFPADDSGRIKCVDLENLYDAVLPEGTVIGVIEWWGASSYFVHFSHVLSAYTRNYITPVDDSQFRHYREFVNESFYEEGSDGHITYLKQEQLSDRNATAHYFSRTNQNGTTDDVDLWYELTAEDKTIYVQERFVLTAYQENRAPYEINILGKQGEYYYNLHFEDLKSRPTEDWLLSFGLKPYVEQE